MIPGRKWDRERGSIGHRSRRARWRRLVRDAVERAVCEFRSMLLSNQTLVRPVSETCSIVSGVEGLPPVSSYVGLLGKGVVRQLPIERVL